MAGSHYRPHAAPGFRAREALTFENGLQLSMRSDEYTESDQRPMWPAADFVDRQLG